MTVNSTLIGVLLHGVASSRPAANAVAGGSVYSATDTGAITQSDGSSWATFATIAAAGMTNPMSAVGDIIQGGTSGAPELLAAPAAGKVLQGAGATTRVAYKYPPGYEIDYVEITSPVNVTATTEATANTIITGNAVTYDGSTIVKIEAFVPSSNNPAGGLMTWCLYDGSGSIGKWSLHFNNAASGYIYIPVNLNRRLTPSNASHTYSLRAFVGGGTGVAGAGAGGSGNDIPAFMRITKVSGGA